MAGSMKIVAVLSCLLLSCGRVKADLNPEVEKCYRNAAKGCNILEYSSAQALLTKAVWNQDDCRVAFTDGRCTQDHMVPACLEMAEVQMAMAEKQEKWWKYCSSYGNEGNDQLEASTGQGNQTRGDGTLLLTGLLFAFFLTALGCMM